MTSQALSNDDECSETDSYVFPDPFVVAEDEGDIYNILTMEVMTEKSV